MLCAGCYNVSYCDHSCQLAHRAAHRPACEEEGKCAAVLLFAAIRRGALAAYGY